MSAAPEKTQLRLAGLDGLRGVACLMVFLYHLRWHAQPRADDRIALTALGVDFDRLLACFDSGVAIFFVLSGLLLSLPYWRAILRGAPLPETKRYLWRRLCRIVPAYYAILLVVYLLRPGTYTLYGAVDFLLHFTFLHTFSDESYKSVYPLLWTIGIEFQFYLILPVMMAALSGCYRRLGGLLTIAGLFLSTWLIDLGARTLLAQAAPAIPDRFLNDRESIVVSGTILSFLKLFAFGIAGALVTLRWNPRPIIADLAAAVCAAGFFALLARSEEGSWWKTTWTGWPTNALAIMVLVVSIARSRYFARGLSIGPVVAMGTISYGIYLWHELIQAAVLGGTLPNLFHGAALFVVGGILSFAITAMVATLSWRCLERPALDAPYPFRP
jgi:peptidoglycan/LPS O-acetylase OafA/YrhL